MAEIGLSHLMLAQYFLAHTTTPQAMESCRHPYDSVLPNGTSSPLHAVMKEVALALKNGETRREEVDGMILPLSDGGHIVVRLEDMIVTNPRYGLSVPRLIAQLDIYPGP